MAIAACGVTVIDRTSFDSRHGYWPESRSISARNFEEKKGKKKKRKLTAHTTSIARRRAPRCAWHLPGSRVKAARARTFAIAVRLKRRTSGKSERESGRARRRETDEILTCRTCTRQTDRTPSSAASASIPFISSSSSRPAYSPTSSLRMPEDTRRIFREIPRRIPHPDHLSSLRREGGRLAVNVIERNEARRYGRTVLCDARYSLVVDHGERSKLLLSAAVAGWVARSPRKQDGGARRRRRRLTRPANRNAPSARRRVRMRAAPVDNVAGTPWVQTTRVARAVRNRTIFPDWIN